MAQLAPWLAEPADPAGSFLKGAQAGGIIAGTRQRQQALNLEARANEARLAEFALDLKAKQANYDYMMQQKGASADLAAAYASIAGLEDGWANPAVPKIMAEVGKKHPAIIGSPIWQHGQDNMSKAAILVRQLDEINELKRSRTPAMRQLSNWKELQAEMQKEGLDPNSVPFDANLFNEKGDWLSPGVRQRLKSMADPSLQVQQREEESLIRLQIAEDRLGLLQTQAQAKGFVPSESGKKAAEYERSVGRPLTDDERGIFYGLKARPGVTHQMLEDEYVQKKLEALMRDNPLKTPAARQQAIDALRKEFRMNFGGADVATPTPPGAVQDNYDRFKLWMEKRK